MWIFLSLNVNVCISAMYIGDCSDGKRTVIEETNVNFICGQYQQQVEWSLSYSNNWPRSAFGYCNRMVCGLYDGFTLPIKLSKLTTSASGSFESRLDIKSVTRDLAYVYFCRNTYLEETAACGLRVIGELDSQK